MIVVIILLILIQIQADEQGYCGDYCTYTFIETTGTMIFDGNYETYQFYYPMERPWDSYKENITEVKITGNIVSLGDLTFVGCSNLKTIDLGKTLKKIGKYAFDSCVSLKTIGIPEQVGVIDSYAFLRCTSLESVSIYGNLFELIAIMYFDKQL